MSLSRLSLTFSRHPSRRVDREDLREAVVRIVRRRWGEDVPLVVLGVSRRLLRLGVPSVPWRTELLWTERELLEDLTREVPELGTLKGLRVTLMPVERPARAPGR